MEKKERVVGGIIFDYQLVSLIVILLIGFVVRACFMAQPMRGDESFTFLAFVNQGLRELFFYPVPNNHVLHTLLVKVSTIVCGDHPISIRLTAFISGIFLIQLVFFLSRALGKSGIFAALTVAVFPYLILYSTNARGYTLLSAITLILALLGLRFVEQPSLRGAALLSLVAALGMLTMPSMVFAIAAVYCWLVCLYFLKSRDWWSLLRRFVIPCGLLTIVFTIIFYVPVAAVSGGIDAIISNRFVQPKPWTELLPVILPHLSATLDEFSRDIPVAARACAAVFMILGLYYAARTRDWPTLLMLPAMLAGCLVMFLLGKRIPYARTWIFIIPFFLVIADAGFTHLLRQCGVLSRNMLLLFMLGAGSVMAGSLIARDAIVNYADTGVFPEAEMIADHLGPMMIGNEKIQMKTTEPWPI